MRKAVVVEMFSLLQQYGVRHVVCSPGSRNAVLLNMADSIPSIKKHIVIDERSAAFIGLGIAMASQEPVALICTSGTAMLNYGPALAEAFYQGIPLIAITADRPVEWIDQDDSQTIRQSGPFNNFVKGCYELNGDALGEDGLWYANRIINEGLQLSLSNKKGPVQFNIHLNGDNNLDFKDLGTRKIYHISPKAHIDKDIIRELVQYACGRKILIVAGFMPPNHKMQNAFNYLLELENVAFMAETVSNLHLPLDCYDIDRVLFRMNETDKTSPGLQPDIVISVGGALISRKLKEFLRNSHVCQHWSVGHSGNIIDCFKALTVKIDADPSSFLKTFAKLLGRKQKDTHSLPSYREAWRIERMSIPFSLEELPWCDLKALHLLLNKLPEETDLFLSNGTSVRYGQIIPYRVSHATYSNRGVSGIEGCTSTALGISLIYNKLTCLITGDMSFEYDLSALYSGLGTGRFVIVLLDNGGGDIFRFINATKDLKIKEQYLCAEKDLPVDKLATAYGYEYLRVNTEKELNKALKTFFKISESPKILHISTKQSKKNSEILRKFLNQN